MNVLRNYNLLPRKWAGRAALLLLLLKLVACGTTSANPMSGGIATPLPPPPPPSQKPGCSQFPFEYGIFSLAGGAYADIGPDRTNSFNFLYIVEDGFSMTLTVTKATGEILEETTFTDPSPGDGIDHSSVVRLPGGGNTTLTFCPMGQPN